MENEDKPIDAPKSCPGTSSLMAGTATGCAGCPNQGMCSAKAGSLMDTVVAQQIADRLKSIKNIILIMSGKGGVGKSSVTACISYVLSVLHPESRIAILDIDITGPSIPTIFGCSNEPIRNSVSGWSPVYVAENLSVMSVGMLLTNVDNCIAWRGPRKHKMVEQLLSNVDWKDGDDDRPVDFLFVDTPPGTTDEHMSIVNLLKAAGVMEKTQTIVVTTPQEVAISDVAKQLVFCKNVSLKVVGIVENMSSYKCGNCGHEFGVFPNCGGVNRICSDFGLKIIGKLPLDSALMRCLDTGRSIYIDDDNLEVEDKMRPSDVTMTALEILVGNLLSAGINDVI